jgi:hypothetical protein
MAITDLLPWKREDSKRLAVRRPENSGNDLYDQMERIFDDEDDLQLSFAKGILTIFGEKRAEKEEKDSRYYRIERAYGSFRRAIEMPGEVEEDNITATFKKGVLTVVLPKSTRAEVLGRRITVTKG